MAGKAAIAKADQRRRKLARIRYEIALEIAAERGKGVRELGIVGVRSLVIMNGGALIGLFTFLGNNPMMATRVFAFGVLAASVAFVLGLVTALISLLVAYRSELENSGAMMSEATWEAMREHDIPVPPLPEKQVQTPPSGAWGIVSLALFVIGALTAIVALMF